MPNDGGETRLEEPAPCVFVSAAHRNREVLGLETADARVLGAALARGAQVQSINYRLRFPEVMISDLSNPPLPICLCNSATILEFHDRVRQVIASTDLRGARLVTGDGLDTELAICGADLATLEALKLEIANEAMGGIDLWSHTVHRPFYGRGIHQTQSIDDLRPRHRLIYERLKREYGETIHEVFRGQVPLLELKNWYQNHQIWKQIADLADQKLFILTAGMKLCLGMVNSTFDERVSFVEVHRQNDPHQLYRKSPPPEIFHDAGPTDTWVVVDKAYTAGSLNLAANRIRARFGEHTVVRRVALFAKSYEALQASDYVVYAGRLFSTAYVLRNTTLETWHRDLLLLKPDVPSGTVP